MKDLWERYRTEHLPRKAPKSQHDDTKMVERYILPHLGSDRRVAEVHHADIAALHRAITGNGRRLLANRVVSCARKMFSLALKPMPDEARRGAILYWAIHARASSTIPRMAGNDS
jgi:hypothetical protein